MQAQRKSLRVFVCFWFLLLTGVSNRARGDVKIVFGPEGLTSLRRGDSEMLRDGKIRVDSATLEQWDGSLAKGETVPFAFSADKTHQTVTQIYRWGELKCVYAVKGDALTLTITLANRSDTILRGVSLRLADLGVALSEKNPAGEMNSGVDVPGIVAAAVRDKRAGLLQ